SATSFYGGSHPSLGLVGRNAHVDVVSAAAGSGRTDWLECEMRMATVRVDRVTAHRVTISEYGSEERTNVRAGVLSHGNAKCLHLRRVGLESKRSGDFRDAPR